MANEKNENKNAEALLEMLRTADASVNQGAVSALRSFFDNGSFVGLSAFMTRSEGSSEKESVECGYGSVQGRPVFAFAQDSLNMGGAVTGRQVSKIKALYKRAIQNGSPVVGFFNSIGGSIDEGSALLSAYGELMHCVSMAKGVVPQVAVVSGKCTGLLASVAQMYDFVITTEDSEMYLSPSFLVGGEFSEKDAVAAAGLSAYTAKDTVSAAAFARELLSLLPLNCTDSKCVFDCEDDLNRALTVAIDENYDLRSLISELADQRRFLELSKEYAPAICTGFATFDGILCGIVANDHKVNEGVMSADACRKAAAFVRFCNSFGIAVVTLVDTVGLEVSAESEKAGIMRAASDMALAYSQSSSAKITVVLGKAYGAGFTLMASRALGADETLALREALISPMKPESAVAFAANDSVSGGKTREEVESEWIAENCPAVLAAANGDIDEIVDASFLRAHLCIAVGTFSSKSSVKTDSRFASFFGL